MQMSTTLLSYEILPGFHASGLFAIASQQIKGVFFKLIFASGELVVSG